MTTVIYITDNNSIGYRPNKFDWQIGEKILTQDGEPCHIIEIVESTSENIRLLAHMIKTLYKYSKGASITKTVNICGLKVRTVIGEKKWKDNECKINYVYSCLETITKR